MIRALSLYLLSIMERRRHVPADDLVTTLIAAQEGDGTLTPMEVVTFTILLPVVGNETTTNLIGNAVNALLDHPDQLERVRKNPSSFRRRSRRRCAGRGRSSSSSAGRSGT